MTGRKDIHGRRIIHEAHDEPSYNFNDKADAILIRVQAGLARMLRKRQKVAGVSRNLASFETVSLETIASGEAGTESCGELYRDLQRAVQRRSATSLLPRSLGEGLSTRNDDGWDFYPGLESTGEELYTLLKGFLCDGSRNFASLLTGLRVGRLVCAR